MECEVVTIGTELLLGFTIDTNAAEIARALASVGVRVATRTTVPDAEPAIADALRRGLERTGLVIATGGLGPTRDDVTKRAAAAVLGAPLELDTGLLADLERRFAGFGVGPMPASNRSQAEVPRGATVLPNRLGSAPGLWMTGPLGTLILLPGVPHEMQALLREQVVSRITALTGPGGAVLAHRTLRTAGISESALADLLGPIEPELSPLELAYLPGLGGVDLRLLIGSEATAHATAALDAAANRLLGLLGDHCYGIDEADLAGVVVEQLRARRGRVAVAESCTGGLIGARITAIPGASDVFAGGIISYEDASKVRELGVEAELIARFGAVSEEVVTAMARGVRRRFQTDTAIAVTGIAGPSGGRPDKPVGTVWTAVAVGEEVTSQGRRFPGGREEVRARAAARALDLLRRRLSRSRA